MSQLFLPPPGQLFASLLFNSKNIDKEQAVSLWTQKWGTGEIFHPEFNPMKKYYSAEMGPVPDLERVIIISDKLYEREELLTAKLWSVEQENLRANSGRAINIDPGLMTLENIILGTGKIYGHRAYLGSGVYADLNLLYTSGSYSSLDWTYPDYKEKEVINFFNHRRAKLHADLKSEKLDLYNARC